jgi:hypothetical protein
MIASFCHWLELTPVSETIRRVSWIVPGVQALHILCVAVLFSSAALLARDLWRWPAAMPAGHCSSRRLDVIWLALAGLLLTGATLVIGEPIRELTSETFGAKMALLVTAVVFNLAVQKTARNAGGFWAESSWRFVAAKAYAIVSMALWAAIITAGRWIAYSLEG